MKLLNNSRDVVFGTVVDCACGEGDGTKMLAGKKIIGVDIDRKKIETAKQLSDNMFIVGSVCNLPLQSSSVDIFICSETLEHLDARESELAVAEIIRVMRAGGCLCITVPADKKVCLQNKYHKRYWSKDDLERSFFSFRVLRFSLFSKNPANKKRSNLVMLLTKNV